MGKSVIKLVQYDSDDFAVLSYSRDHNVRGTLKEAVKALRAIGVDFTSIEEAHVTLGLRGHNVAEFGVVNKIFMYTHFCDTSAATIGAA